MVACRRGRFVKARGQRPRRKSPRTSAGHLGRHGVTDGPDVLAGLVLVLVAVVGMNDADRKAHPQPAPTSPSINPGALCRSGGDNSECGGS
ncbi:DUF6234 family protein [Streptomyces xantholiticus]|uniref:DUF6234 family protein n=1 Tax=Streptomyces xantholiticus TaxID=68285 RepID=A0ABV1UMZ2_9ACTN